MENIFQNLVGVETSQILALTFIFVFGWIICTSVYNRYFHPLAHIPGPFWGSLNEFYKFLVLKSIPTLGIDLHRRYGPIVRIAPNLVICNDPELLPVVYHRKAEKTTWYTSWQWGKGIQAMFLTPSYEEHAARKRIVGPACSLKALKAFEHRFDARIDELCQVFEKRFVAFRKPIDFAEWLRYFLYDTFTHMAYGEPAGCVKHGEDLNGNIQALQDTYSVSASVAILPWLLLPIVKTKFVQQTILPRMQYGKGMSQLFSTFRDRYQKSHIEKRQGFLDIIDKNLKDGEIRAEHITFTAATLDGVAAFISPFIDNMTQHPAVLDKVMAELEDAELRGGLSTPVAKYDEITALPYFQACIMESLRRDAPAQTLLPRVIGSNGVNYQNSLVIPPGTEMAASPYIIHRNARIFGDEPESFRPERWLDGSTDVAKMLKYGMWWGYGERKCAGEHYAQLEMQKLCYELLRRFKIKPAIPQNRFHHEKWAVGMYWNQWLSLEQR